MKSYFQVQISGGTSPDACCSLTFETNALSLDNPFGDGDMEGMGYGGDPAVGMHFRSGERYGLFRPVKSVAQVKHYFCVTVFSLHAIGTVVPPGPPKSGLPEKRFKKITETGGVAAGVISAAEFESPRPSLEEG